MVCDQSTHLWLARFCTQLMQLRSDVSLGSAVRRGVSSLAHSREQSPEQSPEEAARMAAIVLSWSRPLRPPRTIAWAPGRRPASERR